MYYITELITPVTTSLSSAAVGAETSAADGPPVEGRREGVRSDGRMGSGYLVELAKLLRTF